MNLIFILANKNKIIPHSKMMRIARARFAFVSSQNIQVPFPNVNHQPTPYRGQSFDQIMKDRSQFLPKFFFHYYKKPLLITEGHLQYLYDHEGRKYIDLISGISTISVGHSHPNITKAVSDQISKLTHTSQIYAHELQGEYCKKICEELGDDFDNVYLCNSGGEANDFAVWLSRLYTNETKMYSFKNAYHGVVGSSVNLTNIGSWNCRMRYGSDFQKFGWVSDYRRSNQSVQALVADAKETLDCSAAGGKVAGFIFEPVQGVGGINPLPQGYLPQVVDMVRNKYGGLIIADQVQTGFGRIGSKYWGHKWQGIKPDIVTMAKGIANGLPLGAVVTRKSIMDKINCNYFNTFGGGPIQCRVGLQVLKIIKENNLPDNVERVGNYFLTEFKRMCKDHPLIGDVRGKGFMFGVELVKDRQSKQPAKDKAAQLLQLTRERGILLGTGGLDKNVMRFLPPLCLTMEDAKYTVAAFQDALHYLK